MKKPETYKGPTLEQCRKGGLVAGERKRAAILKRLESLSAREAWKCGYMFGYRAGRGLGRQGKMQEVSE